MVAVVARTHAFVNVLRDKIDIQESVTWAVYMTTLGTGE
ncbi:hypothetical protein D037_1986 [Vibrio parahaemolyticus IDH02640]|nr:hypothetical protein D037_1986 [Vibrio parahaemolyticus IDH02640]